MDDLIPDHSSRFRRQIQRVKGFTTVKEKLLSSVEFIHMHEEDETAVRYNPTMNLTTIRDPKVIAGNKEGLMVNPCGPVEAKYRVY